jgi:2-amino-4-hydroxy-6-hydroxymethyldihydropteridine diphosphokinase
MAILTQAIEAIDHLPHTQVLWVSSWMENPAVEIPEGPDFLNGVAEIETSLAPRELLQGLQEIERRHGRTKDTSGKQYQSRTLDLDILLYGNEEIHEEDLVIPHPRMKEREFVMKPLEELLKRVE